MQNHKPFTKAYIKIVSDFKLGQGLSPLEHLVHWKQAIANAGNEPFTVKHLLPWGAGGIHSDFGPFLVSLEKNLRGNVEEQSYNGP